MQITQHGNKIRLQLAQGTKGKDWEILCDFTIYKSDYEELKNHIIENLNKFKPK
jgi:hypothetical protein